MKKNVAFFALLLSLFSFALAESHYLKLDDETDAVDS